MKVIILVLTAMLVSSCTLSTYKDEKDRTKVKVKTKYDPCSIRGKIHDNEVRLECEWII